MKAKLNHTEEAVNSSPNSDVKSSTPRHKDLSAKVQKPKGWIRWSGLIGLMVVIGSLFALGYVISSLMLKNKLENVASEAWGAKVEIESLGLSFDPLGIDIKRIAVTDPEQPMQNLFEIDKLVLSVNLYHLVAKRWVIEELSLQGLALNTPRAKSGTLPEKVIKPTRAKAETAEGGFKLPDMSLPDSSDILARERLETVEYANQLQKELTEAQAQWQLIEARLPNRQSLDSYKFDIDRVFDGSVRNLEDLKQRQEALKQLQQRWFNDRLALHEAQQFIKTQSRDLKQGVENLVGMPKQDVARLMESYAFNEEGLSNITYLLFGETVQENLQMALDWYRKAEPLIDWIQAYRAEQVKSQTTAPERMKGDFIAFYEFDPQPKFMIKQINFDGKLAWGDLKALATDVNFDHASSQKPVRFKILANPEFQQTALTIEGFSTNLNETSVITQLQARWQDYQVSDWQLSGSSSLPVNLMQATNQFNANARLEGLSRLDMSVLLDYQNTKFDLSSATSQQVLRFLAPAFAEVNSFKVEAGLKGRIYAPKFSASSDLDQRLSAGFRQVFQQELAQLRLELEQKLSAQLEIYHQQLTQRLAEYGVDETKLKELEHNIRNIEEYATQKARESEQALRDQLRQEAQKIELEARQKIEKVEQEARARAQALEQEAKRQADEAKARAESEARQKLEQELRQRLRF